MTAPRSQSWFGIRASRSVSGKPESAALAAQTRVYAVGDIHGRADLLDRLMVMIHDDSASAEGACAIVFLGDYVDRGPDSRGVIDRLLATQCRFVARYLRGNHDQTLLDFLENPTVFRLWKEFGAQQTFLSYGIMPPRFDNDAALVEARDRLAEAIPPIHLAFLRGLELSVQLGDYYFAHAGVRPGIPLNKQTGEDLLWIRDDFLMSQANFGKVVVHGHTPTAAPVIRKNRIGVDTGAYATGRLTAVVLEGCGRPHRYLQT